MSSEFPKLQAKFDEILSEFNKIVEAKIESGEIEAVKLSISYENFVPRLASAILPIPSKSKDDIAGQSDAEIPGEPQPVNVTVADEGQRIVIYNENRYKCGSKQTQSNGDILYINCTKM
jgi:hypothetical protein